jgi:hypothetical protein
MEAQGVFCEVRNEYLHLMQGFTRALVLRP